MAPSITDPGRGAPDRFREALESAVEDALAKLPQEVVSALWNALDDERGRLAEENRDLHAKVAQLIRFRREDRSEAARLVRSFVPKRPDDAEARAVAHALELAAKAVQRGRR